MSLILSLGHVTRVLCIGAHADDIEMGCGGALMQLLERDDAIHVHWVVLAADGARADEARRSADRLLTRAADATVEVLSFRERYLPYQPEVKEYFDDLGSRADPEVVFTHRTDDLHQDHRLAAELTGNTFRDHLILQYEIVKYDGDLATPNLYVPLSEHVLEHKIRHLLESFPSQASRDWFRSETFRAVARLRGVEAKAASGYAEGFHCRKLVLE